MGAAPTRAGGGTPATPARAALAKDPLDPQGSGAAVGDAVADLGDRSLAGHPGRRRDRALCDNEADRSRLEAQMDLLEPEHRPELLTGNLDELPSNQVFDWIGGRLATADLQGQNWTVLLEAINRHVVPTTGLRLQISRSELGPAGALLQSGGSADLLTAVVEKEQRWLELQQSPEQLLANAGWQLRSEEWLEHLTLPGGTELAERWLAEGSPYRQAMGEIGAEVLMGLRRSLNNLDDGGLRLPMRHQVIQGERSTP